ncbi:Dna2/Cas4 domain-containing protein [Campylobacter sp. MG1]|uniref:Dna2/Cas4 domain-containing protein n=1 Tax=Campylobacter sp. MG1 TaxID=2976332 RepID=UPI00226C9A49|nr:Dna2/Cas4 domain-containing protein [Campylobacter sp. MG1]
MERVEKINVWFEENLAKVMDKDTEITLGDRSKYIGASDIGGCLRASYLNKVQPRIIDTKQNLVFLRGHLAEGILQKAFQGLNLLSQVEVGFDELSLKAHIDFVLNGKNETLIFECKSVSGIPELPYESWILQVQLQIWLLEKKIPNKPISAFVFAIDVNNGDYKFFEIKRNDFLLKLAFEKIQKLKYALDTKEEPKAEIQGYCGKCSHKNTCPLVNSNETIELSDEIKQRAEKLVARVKDLKEQEKALDSEKEDLKNVLETLNIKKLSVVSGNISITAESTRKSFDSKSFGNDYPELLEKYQKESVIKGSLKIS